MSTDRQYSGSAGSPLKLRTNATRQTEERPASRYNQPDQKRRVIDSEDDDRYYEQPKPRTSAVRFDRPSYREKTQDIGNPKRTQLITQRRFDKWTLITWLCLAVIVMVVGWFLFTKISDWWTGVHDNMVYGTPFRTFQADQYMGMGDTPDHPDHFIALNLHGVIEIIQIDPLNSKKDAVYVLANVSNDSTPASLSFRDTTGSGRTDVIVTIGDSTPYTIVLLNNGQTLTPTQPAH